MSNPQLRAEWLHMITQDPATGEVPVTRGAELTFASSLPSISVKADRSGDYEWEARGPFNFGGRTRGGAFDKRNEDILIAGSVSGGIYKSTNGGDSWTRKSNSEQQWGISCLIQDSRAGKEDTWYAGSGESYNSASLTGSSRYLGNGILKSDDNGETWTSLESTQTNSPQTSQSWDLIWRIALDPTASNDVILAAITGGVMRSEDGGNSWQQVLGGTGANSQYSDIVVSDGGVFYATLSSDGGVNGIFRSEDGSNWTEITDGSFPNNFGRVVLGMNPSDEDDLYFLAATPGSGKQTFNFRGGSEWVSLWKYNYVSGDGSGTGGTWANLSENLPRGPFRFDDINLQGGYNMLVRISPDDPNLVVIGGTNLYRSTSGFSDSTSTTFIGGYAEETDLPDFQIYQNHHPDQHWVFFSETEENVAISCNDGGLQRTEDITATPVVWQSLNNEYNTTQFYTIAIDHATDGSNEMMGGLQDNGTFYSKDGDAFDWKFPWSYDGAYTAIADGGSMHLTSIQLGRMFKIQLDANGNRTGWKRFDPIGPSSYFFIHPWTMDPNDNGIVYLPVGNRLWRNDMVDELPVDNGTDSISDGWFQFAFPLSGNGSCAGVSVSNPANRVYVGTSSGNIYRFDDANATTTFTDISATLGGQGYLNCIAVDPENGDHAVAVFSSYNVHSIHYTEDAGATWFRAGGNLEAEQGPDGSPADLYNLSDAPSIRWAKIMNVNGEKLYLLGTSVGLFATNQLEPGVDRATDATVWYQVAKEEIGNTVVSMIDGRDSDGFVAVATHGAGTFSTQVNNNWVFTGEDEVSDANLISAYPNPTSGNLFIEGLADSYNTVNISVFDLQGRSHFSQTILNKNGRIVLPTEDLVAGIYFARIDLKEGSRLVKFMVI